MTVSAAGRPRRRSVKPMREPAVGSADSMAIGEIDQTVFDCPNCSRPLALGTRRCPGCRTRLMLGVPMSKATIFATAGLAVGVVLGSVGGFVAASRVGPATVSAPAVPSVAPIAGASSGTGTIPSVAPIASAVPTSAGGTGGTDPGMPPIVRSALVQAVTVDEQLAGSSQALRTALATSPFDASEVAQILRSISADAVYAAELADHVSTWPDAATVGADLSAAYGSIHDSATETLVASVRNTTAYRDGARSMVRLLAAVGAIDARARELASAAGAALPSGAALP